MYSSIVSCFLQNIKAFCKKMENSENVSWLLHEVEISLRNAICLLNAALWILVLYFSIYADEIAALLSYISTALSVLTIKYAFKGSRAIDKYLAYFIDTLSKILILAGVSLVLFSQLWNTSFYSICLGILIQKIKYEIQTRERNVNSYLNVQAFSEDAKTDISDQFKSHTYFNSPKHEESSTKVARDNTQVDENTVKNVNRDEFSTFNNSNRNNDLLFQNTTENIEQQLAEIVQKEMQSSNQTLNESDLEISETACRKEISSIPDSFIAQSDESMLHSKRQNNLVESDESKLKRNENLHLLETDLNSDDNESKILEISSKFILNVHLLNIQELLLNQYSTIESELHAGNIQQELKRSEETDFHEYFADSDNKTLKLKFPKDELEYLDIINRKESITEPENKVKDEISNEQANIGSHDFQEQSWDPILKGIANSNNATDLCQEKQNESKQNVDLQILQPVKDNANLFNSELKNVSIGSKQECIGNVINTNNGINRETHKSNLQGNSFEITDNLTGKLTIESKNCTSVETIASQSQKETHDYEVKSISQQINDKDLKTVSEKRFNVLPEVINDFESKSIRKCTSLNSVDYSLRNDSASDVEERSKTTDSINNAVRNEDATLLQSVSNDREAVNSIDLGFIYALGFNVPCTTYPF